MLPWKRNNSATLWTAQEAVSYLQKNCWNQNHKTFLSLLVNKLVSLFCYRSTCVRAHTHGYELFFHLETNPPHTHPLLLLPSPHAHIQVLCSSAPRQTDSALAHRQMQNEAQPPGQWGCSVPSQLLPPKEPQGRSSHPSTVPPSYHCAADSLTVDSSAAVPWHHTKLHSAGAGQHVAKMPSECCGMYWWLTRSSPNEQDPKHWATLLTTCKCKKRVEKVLLLLFFHGD